MKQPLRLLSLLLALILLTGCGGTQTEAGAPSDPTASATDSAPEKVETSTKLNKPPQPDQILSDITSYRYTVLPEGADITGCEVVKRQSNPENKEDIVYCRLTGPEDEFKYSQYFVRLLYNFYDEGGWILDEMAEDQVDQWGPISYLDSEGRPIEDGLVAIGPVIEPSPNSSTPEISINNEGMWTYQGKVYDFAGNQLSGLSSGTCANLSLCSEGGQVYLCDLKGNKLSTGYENIHYAGKVLDEAGAVVDHRWWARRGEYMGFLNDAGQEIIPLIYPLSSNKNYWANFCNRSNPDCARKICVLEEGGANVAVHADGRVLLRSGDEIRAARDGFVTIRKTGYDMSYYTGYNADGIQIFGGEYSDTYAAIHDAGFSAWCGWIDGYDYMEWNFYAWDGEADTVYDKNGDFSFLTLLPGRKCYDWSYDGSGGGNCIMGYGIAVQPSTIVHQCSGSPTLAEITSAYGAYNCGYHVVDRDGNYILPSSDGDPIIYTAIEGGFYQGAHDSDGSGALFDWKGNQRTLFFDKIVAHSENGRYFIVEKDGQYYAMKSPMGEEELLTAPASDIYYRYS